MADETLDKLGVTFEKEKESDVMKDEKELDADDGMEI